MVILSFDSHCLVDILNLEDGLGPRASASIIITPSTKMKASVILVALATTIQAAVDPDGGCTLLSLLPFSDGSIFTHRTRRSENDEAYGKYKRWTANTISMTGYTYSAAVLLAMDHFNNRDSSVVPEIAELPKNCSAFFTRNSKIVDDQLRDVRAGSEIVQSVSKSAPCAILGPFDAVSASWTSVITASVGIPQVFYTHVAQQVTEEDSFANTVRTSLSEQDYASKILSLLVHLGRNHLAVINGGGPYDRNFASTLRVQGRDFGVNVSLFPLVHESSSETTQQNAESVFKNVKESGIRTIFRIFNAVGPKELEKLSNAAEKYHLLEDGYLFVLEEKMAPVDDIAQIIGTQNVSSSLDSLLSGAIVVSPTEPWESGTDSMFLESWKTQNSSFVDRVNNLFPVPPDQPEYFQASSDFFQTTSPRRGAALVYDSVMAIGIGACNMNNSLPINESDSDTRYRNVRELEKFPALPHDNPLVNGIVNSKFTGATGRVAFGEPRIRAKDRTGNDVSYGAFNIRSVDQGGGLMRYEAVLVAKSALRDVWETVNGESFVYRYGKTVLKGPSQVVESNFLRNSIRAIGFTLMAIAWVVALGLSYAVWRWQDKPFVRAGQPVFLAILCVGSFLTSSSILTLSFDEDTGLSVSQLSVLCTVTPWLFFLGINTTFSGLFCKLWRVEQVTQFRRRQVKLIQAAWPLVSTLSAVGDIKHTLSPFVFRGMTTDTAHFVDCRVLGCLDCFGSVHMGA